MEVVICRCHPVWRKGEMVFDNVGTVPVESANFLRKKHGTFPKEDRMEITVKLFALLREKAGTDTIALQVPQDASVSQALEILQGQYPALALYMPRVRLALRQNFVDTATILQGGDELALIPPVSGGF